MFTNIRFAPLPCNTCVWLSLHVHCESWYVRRSDVCLFPAEVMKSPCRILQFLSFPEVETGQGVLPANIHTDGGPPSDSPRGDTEPPPAKEQCKE